MAAGLGECRKQAAKGCRRREYGCWGCRRRCLRGGKGGGAIERSRPSPRLRACVRMQRHFASAGAGQMPRWVRIARRMGGKHESFRENLAHGRLAKGEGRGVKDRPVRANGRAESRGRLSLADAGVRNAIGGDRRDVHLSRDDITLGAKVGKGALVVRREGARVDDLVVLPRPAERDLALGF
jgi:hypothetical protein